MSAPLVRLYTSPSAPEDQNNRWRQTRAPVLQRPRVESFLCVLPWRLRAACLRIRQPRHFVDGTAEIHRAALSLHCDARTACLAGRDSSKGKDHECDEAEHAVRVAQFVPKENSRSSIRIPLGMIRGGSVERHG